MRARILFQAGSRHCRLPCVPRNKGQNVANRKGHRSNLSTASWTWQSCLLASPPCRHLVSLAGLPKRNRQKTWTSSINSPSYAQREDHLGRKLPVSEYQSSNGSFSDFRHLSMSRRRSQDWRPGSGEAGIARSCTSHNSAATSRTLHASEKRPLGTKERSNDSLWW